MHVLECPLIHSSRREFLLLTKLDCFFEKDCTVENLALLVARIREDRKLVNAFARFARQDQAELDAARARLAEGLNVVVQQIARQVRR